MIKEYSFGISEWSLNDVRAPIWTEHIAVCINSLLANTSIKPIFYWIGNIEHPLVKILQRFNVEVRKSDERYTPICFNDDPRVYQIDRSTVLKFEIIENNNSQVFLGDLDILFLKDVSNLPVMASMMAGPRLNPSDKELNAGLLLVDPYIFKKKYSNMMQYADEYKNKFCFEQNILNKIYKDEFMMFPKGTECRPWWFNLDKNVSMVHFHGPKLRQMRNLLKSPPTSPSSNADLFYANKENCLYFFNIAVTYHNYPLPLKQEFDKLIV